jgi:hypothetical protein
MTSLTVQECRLLLMYLNKVTITGHQERMSMNNIVDKLILIQSEIQADVKDPTSTNAM